MGIGTTALEGNRRREFTAHLVPVIPQAQRIGAFWDCGISPKGPSPLPLRSRSGRSRFSSFSSDSVRRTTARGFTLIELILAVAILLILATTALPLTRVAVKRRKEQELRYSLVQLRKAIDRYKDAADKNQIQVKAGTEGYPPDLDTLVKGVQLTGASDKRVHFLAKVPKDPMTGNAEWGMRSVQDDTDSTSWGGQDVFDVYSKSTGTALDGTKYSDW